ncbi:MAG TPA: hypothetical protein DDY31_14195 [Lachnospiraceae bacterium]|nr:hypothetical protein [Lachnospiraceae bacterium]
MEIKGVSKDKECVLLISHSNYMIKSAGVEKSLKDISNVMRQNGIHVIHIFAIIEINKIVSKIGIHKQYIGINIDDKFYGADYMHNLKNCVLRIEKEKGFICRGIQLHHLHGWDLELLGTGLMGLELPIRFFVHDFCSVCENLYQDEGNGKVCRKRIEAPSISKCRDCVFGEYNLNWYKACHLFFESIRENVTGIVAPSRVTLSEWLNIYNDLFQEGIVRSHLQMSGSYKKYRQNEKIRIAFIGSALEHKGFCEWKAVVSAFKEDYELYYFGNSDIPMQNVRKRYVDFQKNTMTMEMALREDNIDMAFLWSTSMETFSYTCYESYAAGCYILTNTKSGNIADFVLQNKAGEVFEDISECLEYLRKQEQVCSNIDEYCTRSFPLNLEPNTDISMLTFAGTGRKNNTISSKRTITPVSLVYKMFRGKY